MKREKPLKYKMAYVIGSMRTQLEYAVAFGGVMLKSNGTGVDFIKNGGFIPIDLDGNGNITLDTLVLTTLGV
jgi:hypothetical protein